MKPQLLKIPIASECSFSVRQDVVPYFYNRWHYHPELELLHIEAGNGTQFIGDSIRNFQAGDTLLIGANLPHYWRCDKAYFDHQSDFFAKSTVVHFRSDFWGDTFLQLPENRPLVKLLELAKQGLRIYGQTSQQLKTILARMLAESGPERMVSLLQTLMLLAQSDEIDVLSTIDYPSHFDEGDTDRINRIYAYSIANFQRKISLEEIANVASLSVNSFCRYFKLRSRKSYSQFLLELRVHHACKLLIDSTLSISQICFECGFNQSSGFNKYFRQIMGKSPMQYRKVFGKEIL
ncbi:AraC family transcriptional regulator [Spirosoma daeguense]